MLQERRSLPLGDRLMDRLAIVEAEGLLALALAGGFWAYCQGERLLVGIERGYACCESV